MVEAELIKCLSERFYSDFADTVARRVRDAGAVGLLYEVVTSRYEGLPRAVGHKVAFRGAYVLEKIYFDTPDSFMPYAGLFCRKDFPACADPSARRHFAKVMADLLGRYTPEVRDLERIAETAARRAGGEGRREDLGGRGAEALPATCRLGSGGVGRHRGDDGARRNARDRSADAQKLEGTPQTVSRILCTTWEISSCRDK
jgi:hypothetical protein